MDIGSLVMQSFEAYRSFQQAHPLLGSMLTSSVIYPLSDIVSQAIVDRHIDWKRVRYSAILSAPYGLGTYGLMQTGDLVEHFISDHPLAKAALGPNLFANAYNLFFFFNNSVGKKSNYSFVALGQAYTQAFKAGKESWGKFKAYLNDNIPKQAYWSSVATVLTAWNAFQWYNFSEIPHELQTPATITASLVWTILISAWSLKNK